MKINRSLLSLNSCVIAVASAAVLLAASARAEILIYDTFDNDAANSPLAGNLPSDYGTSQWAAYGDGQFAYTTAAGGAVSLNPVPNANPSLIRSAGNYIPIPTTNGIVSISADITLGLDANAWAGLNVVVNGSPYGSLLGLLNTTGTLQLIGLFGTTPIATSAPVDNFNIASTYNIDLRINTLDNTASMFANGVQMIAPTALGYTIGSISNTGFFAGGSSYPNGTLDNYMVQTVPEPSTALFVLAGVAGWVVVSRLRRKSVA